MNPSTAKVVKRSFSLDEAMASLLSAGKVVDRDTLRAHDQAREILAHAREQAVALLEEARQEAESIREEAREEAFAQELARWQDQVLALAAEREALIEEMRPQLVDVALAAASKILHQRLEAQPELVLPVVEHALAALRAQYSNRITVFVHPDDLPALEGARRAIAAVDTRFRNVELISNARMQRGGCRLSSDSGEVDASVEAQLAAMRRLLLESAETSESAC